MSGWGDHDVANDSISPSLGNGWPRSDTLGGPSRSREPPSVGEDRERSSDKRQPVRHEPVREDGEARVARRDPREHEHGRQPRLDEETLLNSRERLPVRPPLRVSSLASRVLVPRNVCRNSITLRYHGKTVVLEDDPLDISEVLRKDHEMSRILPHVLVLVQGDVDGGFADHACALTHDVDPVGGWLAMVRLLDPLVDFPRGGLVRRHPFLARNHELNSPSASWESFGRALERIADSCIRRTNMVRPSDHYGGTPNDDTASTT